MPRNAIDYSNTIIYKLCCNDPSITDVYVGHTTNFTRRKQCHKQACNIETNTAYNFYVYQFIRDNGGWMNWSMVEIEKILCIDSKDAAKHERRYFELLGATLNKKVPSRPKTEYRKIYNEEHHEDRKIESKEYREKNKERIHQYREDHKVKTKEYNKIYREANKEKCKEYKKQYYLAHKET